MKNTESGSSDDGKRTGKDMSTGIKCTKCGQAMFVTETRPGDNFIMRYRNCRTCNVNRKTIES